MSARAPSGVAGAGAAAERLSSAATTRLRGTPLRVARIAFAALAMFSLLLCALDAPIYVRALHRICVAGPCPSVQLTPLGARIIARVGLPLDTYAVLVTADTLVVALIFCSVAGVLAWRRSDDWLALLVAYMLVATSPALVSGSLAVPNAAWAFLNNVAGFLAFAPALFLVVYLFPDGRFAPRWVLWAIVLVSAVEAGNNLFPGSVLDVNRWVPNSENFFFFGIFAILAGAQVYRFRRLYSPIQRQQSKWLIFSVALFALFGIVVYTLGPVVTDLQHLDTSAFRVLGSLLFVNVFALLFPVSIAIALLRYRLWDIDLLINRTLVYGSLTAILAAVYFGVVYGAQTLVRLATGQHGQQPVIIVGSTLVIAALFTPLRRRLQTTIDRRFYRGKYDAARTLAVFSATLRGELEPAQLTERLLAVVEETMQPAHISLWLAPSSPHAVRSGEVEH